jgi:hypothetical protein
MTVDHGTYAAAQHCKPRCAACRRAAAVYTRGLRNRKRAGKCARGPSSPWPATGLGWPLAADWPQAYATYVNGEQP